ncbi:MAG: serine/threonine protein kinase [Deltaproteobacteria bacterium]|nr:serine/threonine protein kinase [Deltaproteobacteria bacterium]
MEGRDRVSLAETRTAGSASFSLAAYDLSHADLPPGTLVDDYRILVKLGQGGMGCVYGATHHVIGKKVAIKVVDGANLGTSSALGRFLLEARAVNKIGHPNIVDIFSCGKLDDGRGYLVMEWLDGESLADCLERTKRLPIPEALRITGEICKALDAAHRNGIVHRDLKPHNVFLERQADGGLPMVKLLDFGLAKEVDNGSDPAWQTKSGKLLGTPMYLSPEQARGTGVDFQSDIYALGATVYEMLCGRPPFVAETSVELIAMHLEREPLPPRSLRDDISARLDGLIFKMLKKEPADRPSLSDVKAVITAEMEGSVDRRRAIVRATPGTANGSERTSAVHLGRLRALRNGLLAILAVGLLVAINRRYTATNTATAPAITPVNMAPPPDASQHTLTFTRINPSERAKAAAPIPDARAQSPDAGIPSAPKGLKSAKFRGRNVERRPRMEEPGDSRVGTPQGNEPPNKELPTPLESENKNDILDPF